MDGSDDSLQRSHPTPVNLSPGATLDGRYRIVSLLGEGAMGSVLVAEHLALKKRVAIKTIRAEWSGNSEVAARFAREAMATAALDHPHIASAIDYGTLPDGSSYLVLQLAPGRSLREWLVERGRIEWRVVCAIGAQVADALHAAHQAGIVHRDLKPENILVDDNDPVGLRVRVVDFGIARMVNAAAVEHAGTAITRVGMVVGTPGYMAPEQAMGQEVGRGADLYALGLVLWEMASGRMAFEGSDITAIVTRQLTEEVPPLRDQDPTIPEELDRLVRRLTAQRVTDRETDARRVMLELQALRGKPIPPEKKPRIARRWIAAAAALIALAIVGALALDRASTGNESPASPKREPALPEPVRADVAILENNENRETRQAAARRLIASGRLADTDPFVRALVILETERGCAPRIAALQSLRSLADRRALSTLRRTAARSTMGCGLLRLQDCIACLRGPLRETIDVLEKTATP